jgi:hypothetical protein
MGRAEAANAETRARARDRRTHLGIRGVRPARAPTVRAREGRGRARSGVHAHRGPAVRGGAAQRHLHDGRTDRTRARGPPRPRPRPRRARRGRRRSPPPARALGSSARARSSRRSRRNARRVASGSARAASADARECPLPSPRCCARCSCPTPAPMGSADPSYSDSPPTAARRARHPCPLSSPPRSARAVGVGRMPVLLRAAPATTAVHVAEHARRRARRRERGATRAGARAGRARLRMSAPEAREKLNGRLYALLPARAGVPIVHLERGHRRRAVARLSAKTRRRRSATGTRACPPSATRRARKGDGERFRSDVLIPSRLMRVRALAGADGGRVSVQRHMVGIQRCTAAAERGRR